MSFEEDAYLTGEYLDGEAEYLDDLALIEASRV